MATKTNTTSVPTCRFQATTTATLATFANNPDIFRLDYTTPGGVVLRVRDTYIGADPNNATPYKVAGLKPKKAFKVAEQIFGYPATNIAKVQSALATNEWEVGVPTPHWKKGDHQAAYRLLSHLVSLVGDKEAIAIKTNGVPAVEASIEAFVDSIPTAYVVNRPVLVGTLKKFVRMIHLHRAKTNTNPSTTGTSAFDSGALPEVVVFHGVRHTRVGRNGKWYYRPEYNGIWFNTVPASILGLSDEEARRFASTLTGEKPGQDRGWPEFSATGTNLLLGIVAGRVNAMASSGGWLASRAMAFVDPGRRCITENGVSYIDTFIANTIRDHGQANSKYLGINALETLNSNYHVEGACILAAELGLTIGG